jgi:hypothetical protein
MNIQIGQIYRVKKEFVSKYPETFNIWRKYFSNKYLIKIDDIEYYEENPLCYDILDDKLEIISHGRSILPEHLEPYTQEKIWETLEVGDFVSNANGGLRKVLGICGKIIFLSDIGLEKVGTINTKEFLIALGCTLTPPESTITKEEAEKILGKKIK